ncbi:MAG: hypothetical protein EBZ69_08635, partial [Alphaproteobacteria bacterium]|nr:hypothetical protein [Alphaproteobacteria bacterium]
MAEPLRIELKPKKAQKAAGLIGHEGPVTGEVLYGGKDPLGQSQTVVNITGQYKGASVTYSLGIVEDRHDPAHPQYQFNIAIRNGNQRAAYKINDMARNVQREQR